MSKLPVCRVPLTAIGTAPRCARELVRHLLPCWQLSHLVHHVELVVSELVTHVVWAADTAEQYQTHTDHENPTTLAVQLRIHHDSLMVEVWDCDPSWQPKQTSFDNADYTRSLLVVDSLSHQWGIRTFSIGGRATWASFGIEQKKPSKQQTAQKPFPTDARQKRNSSEISQWDQAVKAFENLVHEGP